MLLAYAKLETDDAVLHTDAARRPGARAAAGRLLPARRCANASPTAVTGHPLRREIVATALTNRAVNIAGVTGLFRLSQETGVPLAPVVRAHAVARAVFGIDQMWDAVRPLDNQVAAATQVELRTEATRLAERAARWLLRQPDLAAEPPRPDRRRDGAVRRPGRRGPRRAAAWLLGAEAKAYAERAAGWRTPVCPPRWPPRSPPRRCSRPHSTSRWSPSGPGRRSRWPGR